MLTINILCVGKIKENYLKDAIAEYSKKLPAKLNSSLMQEIKSKECHKILQAIKKDSYIICLDLKGKEISSEAFSQKLDNIALNFNSAITFIIGGTLGLNQQILSLADESLCFSKMTFPHQLIRVFLLEQLFRAFKISNHETYHW